MYFPALYPIAELDGLPQPLDFVTELLESGCEIIQLRAKSLPDREYLEIARKVIGLRTNKRSACSIVINDRADICLLAGADGVHLGQNDLPVGVVRRLIGENRLLGLSTHNISQLSVAPAALLDYVALGPIFSSKTKSGHAPEVGLETLTNASKITKLPLVAIGGITAEIAPEVFEAGANSVAVISDLVTAESVCKRIKDY